ncbi:hypothetical protein [Succinatimonas hippei]|uniref:Uncharacterized protein n=1 Tax=Succinatimonas hippei (strain DSM 22608 / JCM 16073 / KCTC 15190 / YIT 12066) TaxID=762983 RepID=E8LLC6_SUCHY|nr:hypothetical protein [Succinatimonas hippei]EFY06682.1 hypothetical protein HMPREF9444_01539 [Succinatimonas hippei YIT 12066]MCL1604242.1 hypothetical protein [Succinatimonas hippei]
MKKFLIVCSLLVAFSASAQININDSCLKCRSVADDSAFKDCLTKCLNPEVKETKKQSVDAKKAGWILKEDTDELTDNKVRAARKKSKQGFDYIMQQVYPSLVFMQNSDGSKLLAISFSPAYVLGNGFGANTISVRVDKNEAFNVDASSIWDNQALAIESEELLEQIVTGKELIVRTQVIGTGTKTFKFDLTGSESAINWCKSIL